MIELFGKINNKIGYNNQAVYTGARKYSAAVSLLSVEVETKGLKKSYKERTKNVLQRRKQVGVILNVCPRFVVTMISVVSCCYC